MTQAEIGAGSRPHKRRRTPAKGQSGRALATGRAMG